ncbi:hypothetical protein HC752_05935 [Vibrio sp. S9_S30]|uniref:hypothetical protein n=1 Tax=Vibrio sp. S9_S30 TaxID=2720226 RepID=UPI001680F93D|nr:hypothetical protein [Vibrio sp. S9_S30]MBD1556469.1 hypothetical protein [Vibrio sp. S9_S30]
MKPIFVLYSGLLVLSPTALAEEAPVTTSMDIIATEQAIPCSTELRELARSSLKKNPHRMLAYKEKVSDIHLFNALAVTHYRDRDSHITFHGIKNANGTCDTSVTESYVLQTPCADARHEAFSKWDFQGKLTDKTMVLNSKRIEGKQAFLTDQFTTLCLVTTRQLVENKGSKAN